MAYNPNNPNGQATSANSAPVVLASDQSSVPVAATLSAETTKAIGVVRNADGSGNLLTSTTNALDVNIKSGNPTTMTVTQATGTNLHAVIDSGSITANAGTNLNTSALATEAGSVSNLALSQGSSTSGQKGNVALTATTTAAPTYTTGTSNPISTTTAGALRVDGSGSTQPVSGTVTANAGTNLNTSALALDATLTGGTQQSKITDGTNVATVKAASTAAAATDKALVVAISPNNTIPVSGTVTANAGSGTFAVSAASLPLPSLAATSTKQSDGTQKTQIVDGSGNVNSMTSNALDVNVKTTAPVAGNVASGSADSGNPVKTGGVYNTTFPTLTNGQRGDSQFSSRGEQFVSAYGKTATFSTASTGGQTSIDVSAFGSWAVQMTSSGTSTSFTAEESVDNSNWVKVQFDAQSGVGISSPDATSISGNLTGYVFTGRVSLPFFRVNITVNNGTAAGTQYFSQMAYGRATTILSNGSAANQYVNVAQFNGVTPLMGNGTSGTGAQRVSVSSDSSAIANWGQGATAATAPANAVYSGTVGLTALPTAVTTGQMVGAMSDKYGRQVALLGTIRDLIGTQATTISASTSETTVVTAAASTFNDIGMLVISNTSASTNTRIDFRDTTAGSVLFSLQSNGGQVPVGFALPGMPIPQTSVNTNWTAQCATSTTDIRVYAVFAKNK